MIEAERRVSANNPVTSIATQVAKTGAVSHNTTRLIFDSGETDECWQKVNLIPEGVLWFRVIPFRETVAGMEEV